MTKLFTRLFDAGLFVALALTLGLLYANRAHAATPQDATVQYTPPVVDATHSAASSCDVDKAGTLIGTVTAPGQTVAAVWPDYGTYPATTYGLTCKNSAGAATRVTFTMPAITISPAPTPPNPATQFTIVLKCSLPQGSTAATCVQT